MKLFQSTSPVRGTTVMPYYPEAMAVFQSTSPVRGTTAGFEQRLSAVEISIHVPREGDDAAPASLPH